MAKLYKVLVPLPVDKSGLIALNQAEYFHKVIKLNITVLHILPKSKLLDKVIKPTDDQKANKEIYKSLEFFVQTFYKNSIPDYIDIKIIDGDLVESIVNYANTNNYDLIIIRKSERRDNLFGIFSQNDADRIIAGSYCPVITIKDNWTENGINKILLPIDITQKTDKKVAWAYSFAKKLNAKVEIVSALNAPIEIQTSKAYQKAKEIKDCFTEHNIDCTFDIFEAFKDEPHQKVLEIIKERNPDIIMIMTHRENYSFDKTIGKFATEIIHTSEVPIFTFIPDYDTFFTNLLGLFKNE